MTKKLLKFLVDDEVTFKNGYQYGKFGFYFINEILVINEKIIYTLYSIDNDFVKNIEDGMYTGDEFVKVVREQPKSKHKLNKEKKKKARLEKKSRKVISNVNDDLPYMDAMIGWRLDGKINILRTSQFKTKKDLKDYIKKLYPNSEFAFYQFISWDIK